MRRSHYTYTEVAEVLGYKNPASVRVLVHRKGWQDKVVLMDGRTPMLPRKLVQRYAAARRTATPRPARQDAGRENNERQKDEG